MATRGLSSLRTRLPAASQFGGHADGGLQPPARHQDPEGHCTVTASDPRISGPSTVSPMWDACFLMEPGDPPVYPSGCIYWGDYAIDGPDGRWEGTWTGVDNVELDGASLLIHAEGTEAYEGWSFMGHWLEPFTGEPLVFSGLIYEGPLPPWEPPAE